MKRIGIFTYHSADNLGAVLQAFALQKTIEKECSALAEIVDYRCDAIEGTKKTERPGSFGETLKLLPKRIYYLVKNRGFERFRKNIRISKEIYTKSNIAEANEKYDMLVFGSDQVWNPECSDRDFTYFGDFAFIKKVSYAASIGEYNFKIEEQGYIRELLDSFDSISVRENSAKNKLLVLGIKDALVHPDPVVLLKKDEWSEIMSKRLCRRKYVLVYMIQEDLRVVKAAEEYARKHGLKIINNKRSPEFIFHNSPSEFLSWINYAECVFTNSFHGTILSVIFKKRLVAQTELTDGRENNRVAEILRKTGLEQCALSAVNNGNEASSNIIIAEMRRSGIEYLRSVCTKNEGDA